MGWLSSLFTTLLTPPLSEEDKLYESRHGPTLPVLGVVFFVPKEDITAYELALIVARCRLSHIPGEPVQLYGRMDSRVVRHFEPIDAKTKAYLDSQREGCADGVGKGDL